MTYPVNDYRDLLAFGLRVVENMDVELWTVSCSAGDTLSLHLAGDDEADAVAVAVNLGVDEVDAVIIRTDKTFTIGSRGPRPSYYKGPDPYPYMGRSIQFGNRLVQISVTCGIPAEVTE